MADPLVDGESDGHRPWQEYLSQEPLYMNLSELRQQGWSNPAGDTYFEKRRADSTNTNRRGRERLYKMTQQIGRKMAAATEVFELDTPTPTVLDLCMAPGGFSATTRHFLPRSRIDAVTLPIKLAGYEVIEKDKFRDIVYEDVTMFSLEMDVDEERIPPAHPDLASLKMSPPFSDRQYDLIFCGGAVVKDHPKEEYRKECEPSRLTLSQLVFALNRLKPGGSVVLLLHRVESWDTVCYLHTFSQFADIQLFKSRQEHAIKSSFYLVAKNINLESPVAVESIAYWKDLWKYITFKDFSDDFGPPAKLQEIGSDDYAHKVITNFGPRFLQMARPLWEIQADALRRSPVIKSSSATSTSPSK